MTNGEKKYIGSALRWGLFALAAVPAAAGIAVCLLVPDDSTLKYSDGRFFFDRLHDSYEAVFSIVPYTAAALIAVSVLTELITKQSLAEKLSRIVCSFLLGCGVLIGNCAGVLIESGLSFPPDTPSFAEEREIGGHRLVFCYERSGLDECIPALYEVGADGGVSCLGMGDWLDCHVEDVDIVETNSGYTVYYTYTNGGVPERGSFTAERKEQSE